MLLGKLILTASIGIGVIIGGHRPYEHRDRDRHEYHERHHYHESERYEHYDFCPAWVYVRDEVAYPTGIVDWDGGYEFHEYESEHYTVWIVCR
jgi:hypothetical protein